MKKRALSGLLALALVFTLLPVTARAEVSGKTYSASTTLTYDWYNACKITGSDDPENPVVITINDAESDLKNSLSVSGSNNNQMAGGFTIVSGHVKITGGDVVATIYRVKSGGWNYQGPMLTVNAGATLTLENVNVHGTNQEGNVVTAKCAAVRNFGTLIMEKDAKIDYCTGDYADEPGGGIYNTGTLVMNGGSIRNCTALTGTKANAGGGIYNENGSVEINAGIISTTCEAPSGGGVFMDGGTLTLNSGGIAGTATNADKANGALNATNGASVTMKGGYISGTISSAPANTITGTLGANRQMYVYVTDETGRFSLYNSTIRESTLTVCPTATVTSKTGGSDDPLYTGLYDEGTKVWNFQIVPTGVTLDASSKFLDYPNHTSFTLAATVAPENAENKDLTWSSSNESVATVSGGEVTMHGTGSASITATTFNGRSASCDLTVTASHEHSYDTIAHDANGHWTECSCGDRTATEAHTPATDPAVAATCTAAGKTEGSHCSVCDVVIVAQNTVDALSHSYGTPSYNWSGASCTAERSCTRAGCTHKEAETVTAAKTVTQQQSCTQDELSTYTATFANSAFTQQIQTNVKTADKLGHDYSAEFTVDTPATCETAGSKSKHCSRCDSTTEMITIPATGHDWGEWSSNGDGAETRVCATDASHKETRSSTFTITYAGMDGASYGTNHPAIHTYGRSTAISDPTKPGYAFAGWQVNSGGNWLKNLTLAATAYKADITLTAHWTLNAPEVTLAADDTSATYGTTITLTATASHTIGVSYSYEWYKNNNKIDRESGDKLTLSNISDSGSYTVKVTASVGGETSAATTSDAVTVTIRAAAMTPTVSGYDMPYDGKAHGIAVTMDGAEIKYGTASGTYDLSASPTYVNVGTYTVYYRVTKTNYTTIAGSATVKITLKSIAAVWSGEGESTTDFSWVYDGQPHAPTAAAVTGVDGQTVALSVTGAATDYKATAYTAAAGIYPANGNYTLTNTTQDFTITRAPTTINGSDKTTTYNQNTYNVKQLFTIPITTGTASYSIVPGGSGAGELSGSTLTITKAGTIKIKVETEVNGNYAAGEQMAILTVSPAAGAGSVSMSGYTYGGAVSAPSVSGETGAATYYYNITGGNMDGAEWKDIASTTLNAGDYWLYAKIDASKLHSEYTTAAVKFTVGKVKLTPLVASVTAREYNGGTDAEGTLSLSGAVSGQSPSASGTFTWTAKNAGTTTVNVSNIALTDADVNRNYELSAESLRNITAPGGAKISPKALTAPAKTVTYNGGVSFTQEVDGENGEKATITYTASSKSAGDYAFSLTAAKDKYTATASSANYRVIGGETLTIDPLEAILTWSGAGESTYNGNPRSVTAAVSNKIANDTVNVDVSGGAEKNARVMAYTAAATGLTGEDAKNYKLPSGKTTTYTIKSKSISGATVTLGDALTYTGAEQTQTVTGVTIGGLNVTYEVSGDKETAANTYALTVTGTGNFTGTQTQQFTIAPKPVALTWDYTSPFPFTGGAQTVAAEVSNKVKNDTFAITYTNNSKTAADSYTAAVTGLGNSNYTLDGGTNLSQAWTILKAPISFAVSNNSYGYDAQSHTATVAQTAEQLPTVGGGFTVDYKLPAEDIPDATAGKTDAGEYDIIVTLSDDNFRFDGQPDTARSLKVGTLTIGKKPITAQWKNLSHVYDGGEKSPVFEFADGDILSADVGETKVSAALSGDQSKSAAGSYTVRATLEGTRAHNYELTNPTGSFVIQRAPVTFTVTDDSAQHDGNPHAATVTADIIGSAKFTVTHLDSRGNTGDAPTDVGSYDVCAAITDSNYRHAGAADGGLRKVGVLTIYRHTAPAVFAVSFVGGKGATGTTDSLAPAQAGTARVLPDCGFSLMGNTFIGWKYGGSVYRPGETLTQPAANITLTAVWIEQTYFIEGVVDENGTSMADVVVTLMLGSKQIEQTSTNVNGEYSFSNVLPGLYNLVASKNGVTKTILVEIVAENETDKNITMPAQKTSSVVEVAAGSPAIVVGELDKTFAPEDVEAAKTGSVEMKLTAEAVTESEDGSAIESESSGTVGLLLDVTLTKTVINADGTTSDKLEKSPVLLQLVINLPGGLQGKDDYTVYRVHEGVTGTLTSTPNENGEYIAVNAEKTAITVYAKCFSTYAVVFTTYSGGTATAYKPVIVPTEHGSVAVRPNSSAAGAKATVALLPNEGYKPASIKVTDRNGKEVALTQNSDGAYSFTQPAGTVTIKAAFKLITGSPFTDVTENDWFYGDVAYVFEHGLIQGTGDTIFSPHLATTRGMTVTILYRLEGGPAVTGTCPFDDVISGKYYEKAILWAAENGIVEGYGNAKFGPDDPITREQMAAILYRCAQYKGYDVTASADLSQFIDEASVSGYAKTALSWANANGLINGKGGGILDPGGNAERCQVAAILHRFCENVVTS